MSRRKRSLILAICLGCQLVAGTIAAVAMWRVSPADPPQLASAPEVSAEPVPVGSLTTATGLTVARPLGRPLRVAFIGDSLTVGAYATTEDRTFRGLAVRDWRDRGSLEQSVYARSGATTREVNALVPDAEAADIMVIETGTNDIDATGPSILRRDYTALLDKVRAGSPDAQMLCLGAWDTPDRAREIDAQIEAVCTDRGGRFVSLIDIFADSVTRGPAGRSVKDGTSDEFHPNDSGHARIAQALTGTIAVV